MELNINTDKVVAFTNKLETLHRSALPVAIRGALNNAAFDVKQNTMLKTSTKEFINRNRTFFKANSRVEMAKGFNVDSMKAKVGFVTNRLRGNDQAVEDLEQQEHGGSIKGRAYIPLKKARGGSWVRAVRPSNRLGRVKNVVNSNKVQGKTPAQRFTRAAIMAGKGGYVLGNLKNKILWKITSVVKNKNGLIIKKIALYTYDKGRSVKVKATGFMEKASKESGKKIEKFYITQAKKQIKRLKG